MFSGNDVLPQILGALRTKTPFLRSENFRRIPEDSIFPAEAREKAGVPVKDIDGIFIDTTVGVSQTRLSNNSF